MRRRSTGTRALGVALGLVALAAAPAAATVMPVAVSTTVPGLLGVPVLAGGGAAWAEGEPDGSVVVRARVGSAPADAIARLPPHVAGDEVDVRLSGSADSLVITRVVRDVLSGHDMTYATVSYEALGGPIGGPFVALAGCHPSDYLAGAGFAAVLGPGCETPPSEIVLRPLSPGGPSGVHRDDVADQVAGLQVRGDWVAWIRYPKGSVVLPGAPAPEIVVMRASTHQVALRVPMNRQLPGGEAFTIDDDGTLFITDPTPLVLPGAPPTPCAGRLAWRSPADPDEHVVPGVCPLSGPQAAHGHLLVRDRTGLRLVDLTGAGRPFALMNGPFAYVLGDFDGTSVLFGQRGCAADAVLLTDGTTPPPSAAPDCSGRLGVHATIGGLTAGLAVGCPHGCRGRLIVRQSRLCRAGYRRLCYRTVADGLAVLPAGRRVVQLDVRRWARRLARCGRMRAVADLGTAAARFLGHREIVVTSRASRPSPQACARYRRVAPAYHPESGAFAPFGSYET